MAMIGSSALKLQFCWTSLIIHEGAYPAFYLGAVLDFIYQVHLLTGTIV
jgi:hypothetical protein